MGASAQPCRCDATLRARRRRRIPWRDPGHHHRVIRTPGHVPDSDSSRAAPAAYLRPRPAGPNSGPPNDATYSSRRKWLCCRRIRYHGGSRRDNRNHRRRGPVGIGWRYGRRRTRQRVADQLCAQHADCGDDIDRWVARRRRGMPDGQTRGRPRAGAGSYDRSRSQYARQRDRHRLCRLCVTARPARLSTPGVDHRARRRGIARGAVAAVGSAQLLARPSASCTIAAASCLAASAR